jgi:protocatechuate 3,4-dioxygenase beta subunit
MQTIRLTLAFVSVLIALSACAQPAKSEEENKANEIVQNNPPSCDCCVFDEVKNRKLSHIAKIAPDTVQGERIKISGVVYKPDGKTPATNLKMYFYHTNNNGKYAKLGSEDRSSHAWWHGYCRGWLQTNERGEYEINTIKPKAYPNGNEPAHIHSSFLNTDKSCSHLVDFVFKGDEFLTKTYWDNTRRWWKSEGIKGEPEYEGVAFTKNSSGILEGKRNIVLQK